MKFPSPLVMAALIGWFGLAGCEASDAPPVPVGYAGASAPEPVPVEGSEVAYVPPGAASTSAEEGDVEVETVDDFDEPLQPYGEWMVVGSYGRCWRPSQVAADWRPYCNGHWESTDQGWYWVSDEPWGWATYHYGRWFLQPGLGWLWIPQTRWAPAWVAWRNGGGYTGWAPLPPSARFGQANEIDQIPDSNLTFVFVQDRRFTQPVRPNTVIVNNTTIVRETVNITKISLVNQRVHNGGPPVGTIEKASGQSIHSVQTAQLRRQGEAPVVARHPALATPHAATARPAVPAQPYHNALGAHPTLRPLHHENTLNPLRPAQPLKPLETPGSPKALHPLPPMEIHPEHPSQAPSAPLTSVHPGEEKAHAPQVESNGKLPPTGKTTPIPQAKPVHPRPTAPRAADHKEDPAQPSRTN